MLEEQALKALERISKLYHSWNLSYNDWVLMSDWALYFNGYVVERRNHFNTPVNRAKLPWKPREDYQTIPPINSKEYKEYIQVMKETGFQLHIAVFPWGEITQENILKYSFIHELPNKEKIRIFTVEGEVWVMTHTFERWKDEVGREKRLKWIREIKNIKEIAKRKNDRRVLEICNKFFERFKIF
jgi:hypothetical protein